VTDRLVPDPIDGDNTAMLNEAHAALRRGDRLIFPDNVDYVCEGTVVLGAKTECTVDWNGSRIVARTNGLADTTTNKRANRNRAHYRVAGGIDNVVNDYACKGPKPDDVKRDPNLEAQHGMLIQSGDGTVINWPVIENVWGDGFYVSKNAGKGSPPARNVYVTDPTVSEVGRHGIAPILCEDVYFLGGSYREMGHSFCDVELEGVGTAENPAACRRVTIEGRAWTDRTVVANYSRNLLSSMGAAAIVEDITLRWLDVRGKPVNGQIAAVKTDADHYPKKRITIAGCVSDYTKGAGWMVRAVHIERPVVAFNEQRFDLSRSQPKQWPDACALYAADCLEPKAGWNDLDEKSGRTIPQMVVV
jgi:hypothetical protein